VQPADTATDRAGATVARADALAGDDWAAAIDLLDEADRRERADDLEIALARHRLAAFGPLLASQPPLAPHPEPATAPAVGPSGLPEVELGELTAGVLRAAILDRGVLVVRGAVDPATAAWWADAIDRCLDRREATRDDPSARTAWWQPLPVDAEAEKGLARKWIRAGGGTLLADSPRLLAALLQLYTDLGLRDVAREYLGGRPVLSANKCTLRRVDLDATGSWHQDGAFLGRHVRALNLWLGLTPCGVDAPGLAIVPRRYEDIVETGSSGSHFDWAAAPDVVVEAAGDAGIVRPTFDAGDLLLFDEMLLHSTTVDPSMTRPRHAIESWCFAPAAYPNGHVPLVW
jgi:hypothetical protein